MTPTLIGLGLVAIVGMMYTLRRHRRLKGSN